MPTIGSMRLLGGRPCLDFVNTVDDRRDRQGPDLVRDFGDLLGWCERVAVLTEDEARDAAAAAEADAGSASAALSRAKSCREAMWSVLCALAEGTPQAAGPLGLLGCEVAEARRFQSLEPSGGSFAWAWRGEAPLDRPVHRIALDCAALVTDGRATGRLKRCPGPACGWLFLDESRNGGRRWCSEETCGTAARVARHRARMRAGR